jgi:hypothetical protein
MTRPASFVEDRTYSTSHQHYRDYVKQNKRDLGEGTEQSLRQYEEEQAKAQARREGGSQEDEHGWPIERVGGRVEIGGPGGSRQTPPSGGWGKVPREAYGVGDETRSAQSLRAALYGDEAVAPEVESSFATSWNLAPLSAEDLTPPGQPSVHLAPPNVPSPEPTSPWNLAAPEAELPIPGTTPPLPEHQDKNIERLMGEGKYREAHRIALRLLEVAARLGDADKRHAYQSYVARLERLIAANPGSG